MNAQTAIVPYLFFDDAGSAMDFYARVFGFEELSRWHNDAGKVQNGEMRVGTTELWLDGGGKRADTDQRPQWVGVLMDSAAAVDAMHVRVTAAGFECEPPTDRDFGVRMFNIDDGMGYLWGFLYRDAPQNQN